MCVFLGVSMYNTDLLSLQDNNGLSWSKVIKKDTCLANMTAKCTDCHRTIYFLTERDRLTVSDFVTIELHSRYFEVERSLAPSLFEDPSMVSNGALITRHLTKISPYERQHAALNSNHHLLMLPFRYQLIQGCYSGPTSCCK